MNYLKEKAIPYVKEKYIAVMNDYELDFLSTCYNHTPQEAARQKDENHSLIGGLYALSEKEEFKVASVHFSNVHYDKCTIVAESKHGYNQKVFSITPRDELINPDDWKIAEKLETTKNNLNRNITQTNTSEQKNTPKNRR